MNSASSTNMQTGTLNPAGQGLSGFVREHQNDFPEIRKVNEQIDELETKSKSVDEFLACPGQERIEGLRKEAPELYKNIHQAVMNKENSTAFRICAGTWLAGLVASVGVVISAFTGGAPGLLASLSFPLTMAAGTAVSRLYLAGSEKWRVPGKEDELAGKVMKEYKQKFDERIGQLNEQKEAMLKKHMDSSQQFADGANSLDSPSDAVKVDDDMIDIDGVRLRIKKNMDYTVIPVVPKKTWP